jgi:TetR/AcrR family transcriptional repressor of nem operon
MQDRRDQIIERASAVVYRQGFGATTIADVLSAAAVGKGNFYHYFKGKEDLGLAIIDSLGRAASGTDLDEIFSTMKPPLRRLSDYLSIVSKSRRTDYSGDPLCTLASELGALPPYAEHIRAAMASLLDRIEALIAEFALETRASIDARTVSRAVIAQIHGLCIQYKVDRDVEAFDAGIAAVPALLTGAIGSPASANAPPSPSAPVPGGRARTSR